jgi:hypothetical protein
VSREISTARDGEKKAEEEEEERASINPSREEAVTVVNHLESCISFSLSLEGS